MDPGLNPNALMTFLDRLDEEGRALLLSVARPVSFVAGSTLVRHGEPARGAYVLREGSVDAVVTMPGGESHVVATLGAGSIFGEMALIELGTYSATARATQSVDGWFVSHEDFRALVSQSQPAARRLQHAVTLVLAEKLATLNAHMLACSAAEDRAARPTAATDPLAGVQRMRNAPFAAAGFLPKLAFFERCSAEEIDELVAGASYVELPRGHGLFLAGLPAEAAFLVVRGAVEVIGASGACERRIAVLGPGQLVGYLSVLRESQRSSSAYAREACTLLEFPAAAFRAAYFGPSRAASRLRHAVQASMLASMARTNRALMRLLSQAKLDAAPQAELQLEAVLATQITAVTTGSSQPA